MSLSNLKPGTRVVAENPEKGIAAANYDGRWVYVVMYLSRGRWVACSDPESMASARRKGYLCLLRKRPAPGQHVVIRKTGKDYAHGFIEE